MKEKTQSVRINKEIAKAIKAHAVEYEETMKSILEKGAALFMNRQMGGKVKTYKK